MWCDTINDNEPNIIEDKYLLLASIGECFEKLDNEDVYNLYALNEKNDLTLYSSALVNDFKTSHFLKKLFRIKTNYKNIEFSDSEDEDAIINEKKEIYVSCIYIHEFKKWKPYLSKRGEIDSTKIIIFKEKKNIAL